MKSATASSASPRVTVLHIQVCLSSSNIGRADLHLIDERTQSVMKAHQSNQYNSPNSSNTHSSEVENVSYEEVLSLADADSGLRWLETSNRVEGGFTVIYFSKYLFAEQCSILDITST